MSASSICCSAIEPLEGWKGGRTLKLTTHADLVRAQLRRLPHGGRPLSGAGSPVRAGITGSGADLLVLTWSAADLEREREAGVRLLQRIGLRAGMRLANALPGALATPGSLLLGDVVEDLGGLDVPVGAIDSEAAARQAWALIDLVEPQVVVLDAASAVHLLAAAPAARRAWWQGILWLRREGEGAAFPEPPPACGFEGWQRVWLAVPEATSFAAVSCAASCFHLDEAVAVEIVEGDSGERCAPGEPGWVVVTAHGFEAVRESYLTRFRGRLLPDPCACGGPGPVLQLDA